MLLGPDFHTWDWWQLLLLLQVDFSAFTWLGKVHTYHFLQAVTQNSQIHVKSKRHKVAIAVFADRLQALANQLL